MSMWGAKRQRTYISVILGIVIVFLAIVVVRNVDRTPTCFDGKQNGSEEGVDCGGSCALVCQGEARHVTVHWTRAVPVTENVYHVLSKVENQNVDAGITSIRYRFRLYDAENILVGERTGTTFIDPNQETVVFEPSVTTGSREPVHVFFEFLEDEVWQETDARWGARALIVRDRVLENTDTQPRLVAKLDNMTLYTLTDIEVVAVLYDEGDNVLQVSRTVVPRIGPDGCQDIFFTWPRPLDRDVVRIEILPRVNVFEQADFK